MNWEAVVVAVVAAVGPTVAALAAWRQAKGTRSEVTTNNGKRAGEYLEMLGKVSADMHVMRIEGRVTAARLAKQIEALHQEHGEILSVLDDRVTRIEGYVGPQSHLGRGRIAQ